MLPEKLQRHLSNKKAKKERRAWKDAGRPLPPPSSVKRKVIDVYRRKRQLRIFVETGTLYGDTIWTHLHSFEKLYSIELSEKLYEDAVKRFKKYRRVRLLQGDSGVVLGKVVARLRRPALFWLDGHYSSGDTARGEKDCPIIEELNHILSSELNHVILIDDARCFVNEGEYKDYPTISFLKEYVLSRRPNSSFKIKDDIIRIKLRSNIIEEEE